MDKPGLALLIGKMRPGEEDDGGEDIDARATGLQATADEIIAAVQAEDSQALAEALRDFVIQCQE